MSDRRFVCTYTPGLETIRRATRLAQARRESLAERTDEEFLDFVVEGGDLTFEIMVHPTSFRGGLLTGIIDNLIYNGDSVEDPPSDNLVKIQIDTTGGDVSVLVDFDPDLWGLS